MERRKKCKTCGGRARARELCATCYQAARRVVRSGKASWSELEKLNLVGNSQPRSSFAAAFNKAKR